MAGKNDFPSSLQRRKERYSSRSETSSCKVSSADYQDVFGGPVMNSGRRKSLQDLSSLWEGLPDLNQNIMAEIVRRRNVTEEFYDDIFTLKNSIETMTASVSSSEKLDPFLSRSAKDQEATNQICDGLMACKKAVNEYPIYGEKVRSLKDWIPEEVGKNKGKAKQGHGDGEDEFGSYVIEFDSHVKKEAN
ncbi:hypothetical protein KI387_014807 [Taxus chinensis]|uniref:Uncharacterized protein n=1 Tax=Taxus chinensis TaxID=29808 RepID=A0AA38CV86_TAXCH|nr:hypothetical protein KI387_014807 [Taxus chinensis]